MKLQKLAYSCTLRLHGRISIIHQLTPEEIDLVDGSFYISNVNMSAKCYKLF